MMYTIVENGLTIAAIGTAAYVGLGWLMDLSVQMFTILAMMLPAVN